MNESATSEEIREYEAKHGEPHPVFDVPHRPERINLERHTGKIPRDVQFTAYQGHILCSYVTEDNTVRLFEVVGESGNPRVWMHHDAIVRGGTFLTTHWNGVSILLQHPFGGTMERVSPEKWEPDPSLLLEKLPPARK